MKNNDINICYATDANYIPHMCASIVSILSNAATENDYNFYILGNKIPQQIKQKIEKLKNKIRKFNITYFNIENDDFKNCPITGYVNYITKATYYRFKIPELLWNIDRVLYLDSDTIVMADISELYNVDMEENYIAAVPEAYNYLQNKRLEIIGDNYYCNAGVILMNLNKIRKDGIDKLLFKYAECPTREIIYQDQDILNEVLKYKIKYLPLAWNLQHDAIFYSDSYPNHEEERYSAISAPKLIHFTNKYKPWHYRCQNPYRKEYLRYLKKTHFRILYFKILLFNFMKPIYQKTRENYTTTIKILGIKFKKTDKIQCAINKLSELTEKISNTIHDFNIEQFSISSKHLDVFGKYRNINNGKDVVLIATGPSVKKFQPIENAVYVGVNRAFQVENINYDYMFLQDYSGSTKTYIGDFINYNPNNTKKFLGFITPYEICPESVIPDFYSYYTNVERYFVFHPKIKSNFTFDISRQALGDSYSVVFPAMQFILWTNPKRIYIVGCDCNTSGNLNCVGSNYLAVDSVLEGWKKLKIFANTFYPNTEIISINPVGLKGMFKDIIQ